MFRSNTPPTILTRCVLLAILFILMVMGLGAYTRLKDAGLGCPDWPGCYGHYSVPNSSTDLKQAEKLFPNKPVVAQKAWPEMIHRYAAGILILLSLFIVALSIANFSKLTSTQKNLLFLFLILLGCQAALGRWTVTLLLLPWVVTLHLLTGISLASLLWLYYLNLRHGYVACEPQSRKLVPWLRLGVALICVQITLGAWTSTNYAALICPDFPTCQQQWFPKMSFSAGFKLLPAGTNYEGGTLDTPARTAIHVTHRIGAMLILSYWSVLLIASFRRCRTHLLISGTCILTSLLLCTQLMLGVSNVVWQLPIFTAVAHNMVAVLLLLSAIKLTFLCKNATKNTYGFRYG